MPFTPDFLRARHNRSKHSATLTQQAQLPHEIGIRLLDHLEGLKLTTQQVLYLGAGSGWLEKPLLGTFPDAKIVFCDVSLSLLQAFPSTHWMWSLIGKKAKSRLACDMQALPFKNACFDLVIAHGVLPWCEPQRAFAEARRVLKQDGLLLFSSLGPDTYKEWRAAGSPPMLNLIDMHDLADLASHAGFTSPVVDMEYLTVFYPNIKAIISDLRGLGGGNGINERPRGLMTPRTYRRLQSQVELTRTAEGLPQTLELIYGHAWNTRPLVTDSGRPVIPIQPARGVS